MVHPHALSSPGYYDSQDLVFLHVFIVQHAPRPSQVSEWNWKRWHGVLQLNNEMQRSNKAFFVKINFSNERFGYFFFIDVDIYRMKLHEAA